MIDQIVSALKLSLAECNKYEEPARYIFELSEVLLRYKTNIYRAAETQYQSLQDPKELFNARINLSWRTRPTYGTNYEITDRSPVLLHVNGIVPAINERINREQSYNHAIDISDVIDLDKIAGVKTDWYEREQGGLEIGPEKLFEEHPEVNYPRTSVYFSYDRTGDGRIYLSTQINSTVEPSIERASQERIAAAMQSDPRESLAGLAKKALLAQGNVLPVTKPAEPVRNLSNELNQLFETRKEQPKVFRSKNHLKPLSAAKMNRGN